MASFSKIQQGPMILESVIVVSYLKPSYSLDKAFITRIIEKFGVCIYSEIEGLFV